MKRERIAISIVLLLLIETILFVAIQKIIDKETRLRLEAETSEFRIKAESSIRSFNLVSETIFSQIINKEPVLKLYSRAYGADSLGRNEIRQQLYQMLIETYEHLKTVNIKQLHFHLPDNESFLRFHRPEKYGDNLTEVRYSVRMANEMKKAYQGFEEGRIYNGFRYVFPLSYKGEHIGSVETSFSFGGIRSELRAHGVTSVACLIRKDVVDQKVFPEEMVNYIPSLISDRFVNEAQFLHYANDSARVLERIDRELKEEVQERLAKNEDFTLLHKIDDRYYKISFLSIDNVEGKPVAYLLAYSKDDSIIRIIRRSRFYMVLLLVIIPLLIVLIYLYIGRVRKIHEQNQALKVSEEKLQNINSRLQEQTKELKEKNAMLNELNLTKERFNSIIAHDLKNPFHALIGFSDIIAEECRAYNNPELNRYCFLIRKTIKHSYDLLENLLHWTRIQSDRVEIDLQSVNLKDLCAKIIDFLEISISEKKVIIKLEMEPGLSVRADPVLLHVIVRNLLSNAIKFSFPGGEIIIRAHTLNDRVQISVEDFGVGIDKKNIRKVFRHDEFYSTQGTNEEHGTGLGLKLCREFVEKQGGKIEVESKVDQGTKFIIIL